MTTLKWSDVYYQQLAFSRPSEKFDKNSFHIGTTRIDVDKPISLDGGHSSIPIDALVNHVLRLEELTFNSCHPQLAYLVFAVTHRPSYMETYFPLVKHLNKDERHRFHETVSKVMLNPGFDVQLLRKNFEFNTYLNVTQLMPAIGYLVGGQIVEMFFYRQDILDALLQGTMRIWLYTEPEAFKDAGGVAGGCYNPQHGCVQLVVNRLFEGFHQPTPGAAPFIHEFGHLLDYFDAGKGQAATSSSGFMPGLRQSDGAIYTPDAREAFMVGKRLEMERYDRQVANPDGSDPLPIGHPYVFQSNSEFIAGYLEMFFRNPHYFAAQNRDLYDGFARYFGQDPRQYWEADFPYYVNQNRGFYQSGQRPRISGLTLETD